MAPSGSPPRPGVQAHRPQARVSSQRSVSTRHGPSSKPCRGQGCSGRPGQSARTGLSAAPAHQACTPGLWGGGGPASVGLRTLRGTTRLRAGQNVTPGQPTGGAPGRPPSTAGSRELSRCAYPVPVGAHPRHAPGTALSRELPCAEHWMNTAHGPPQPDGGGGHPHQGHACLDEASPRNRKRPHTQTSLVPAGPGWAPGCCGPPSAQALDEEPDAGARAPAGGLRRAVAPSHRRLRSRFQPSTEAHLALPAETGAASCPTCSLPRGSPLNLGAGGGAGMLPK